MVPVLKFHGDTTLGLSFNFFGQKDLTTGFNLSRLAQFGQIVVRAPCGENPWSLLTNLPLWRWNLLGAAFQKQVRMAQGQRDHPRCSMTELDQSILTILESIGCYRFCWLLELPSASKKTMGCAQPCCFPEMKVSCRF